MSVVDDAVRTRRWTKRPEGSTWGDFGADDQTGRLNMITAQMRLDAVKEVREGRCFVLSLPLDYPGGESPTAFRQGPKLFARNWGDEVCYNMPVGRSIASDDHVVMSLQYSTQWDGLAHCGAFFDVNGDGKELPVYYNGWRAHEDIVGPEGDRAPCAHKLGIENMAITGVQGRGVLVDLVRAFGPGNRHVSYEDLMRAIDDQKVEVRKGDFLLLYTGYGDAVMAGRRNPDPKVLLAAEMALDGTDQRLLNWITDSGAVSLIADNTSVEHVDSTLDHRTHDLLPLHTHCIFKLGMHLGELFWLSELADHLHQAGRHSFLFTGPPLRLPGACGSPASPVATV
jgi:kynurenine formamidase